MAKKSRATIPSSLPAPHESGESLSPSACLIEQHGLNRVTNKDTRLHSVLQQSTAKIHALILKDLQKSPTLDLDTASKIADRLTRSLKTHYELLALKGKIHQQDDRRGKIIARVGIRQTEHGQEAVAEVEVNGHHPT